jgi:hypothetical protein
MKDEVIGYCESQLLWKEFLRELEEHSPRQYSRFASQTPVSDYPAGTDLERLTREAAEWMAEVTSQQRSKEEQLAARMLKEAGVLVEHIRA